MVESNAAEVVQNEGCEGSVTAKRRVGSLANLSFWLSLNRLLWKCLTKSFGREADRQQSGAEDGRAGGEKSKMEESESVQSWDSD